MKLDLDKFQIRRPKGDELIDLYRFLISIFEVDRLIFEEIIRTNKKFYTFDPYTLYMDGQIVSNVSLLPVNIYLDGKAKEVVGIASVATADEYRGKGLASYLLQYCMEILDEKKKDSVLFSAHPSLYEKFGFETIEQNYVVVKAEELKFDNSNFELLLFNQLNQSQKQEIAAIYSEDYPNYDGKVVRDEDYWQLNEMLFNSYEQHKIILCKEDGQGRGYLRFEIEADRISINELCVSPERMDVSKALLGYAADYALKKGFSKITIALCKEHFVFDILNNEGIEFSKEIDNTKRESFMVRLVSDRAEDYLRSLQWSLADKF